MSPTVFKGADNVLEICDGSSPHHKCNVIILNKIYYTWEIY